MNFNIHNNFTNVLTECFQTENSFWKSYTFEVAKFKPENLYSKHLKNTSFNEKS